MNDQAADVDSNATQLTPAVTRKWSLARWMLVVCTVAAIAIAFAWIQQGPATAQKAIRKGDFATARSAAERYLWLHSADADARMLAARAYFMDDVLLAGDAADGAIGHLQKIEDGAPLAAEARMLEGRLTFLILLQPTRAQELFERSLALDPGQFDSNYLLWKLHDMTERYFDGEQYFRAAYQKVPPEQKSFRLREWYISQFSPHSACAELDALMGFRTPTEPTNTSVAFRRLSAFAINEPDSPITAAAIAQAYLRNRQRDLALQTLDELPDSDAIDEPFFKATLIEVLLELGQVDRAKAIFSNWSLPKTGYRYWRTAGMVAQIADGEFETAANCFEQALAEWPGPSDWLTMHRRFRCLALMGDKEGAEAERKRSEKVEELMELEGHQRQKLALANLEDPDGLQEILDFYGFLQRPWELEQWQLVVDNLRMTSK